VLPPYGYSISDQMLRVCVQSKNGNLRDFLGLGPNNPSYHFRIVIRWGLM